MPDRPNVVWIYCDELRTDALGCYGGAAGARRVRLRTPHVDSIAEGGVRFDNCFCNSPVCVSSRVCTLTGLYPEQTGVYHNEAAWPKFVLPRPLLTFPEVFARHGYATADFGKLHLPPEMQPWQHRRPEGGGMRPLFDIVGREGPDIITSGRVRSYIGGRFPAGVAYPPEQLTRNALAWLARAERPFLARLSYVQPHTPVYPPPPFDALYAPEEFGEPAMEAPAASAFERRFAEVVGAEVLTGEQVRRAQACYYGLVAWVDSQVGRVLEFLHDSGRDRDTIVVFGADHGASLGEGGCYAKHIFAPQVHRVPRLIACPALLPAGSVRTDICESLDLARTLFGLCGIDPPEPFGGRDLFADEAPEAVYATIGFGLPDSRAFPNCGAGTYVGGRGWPRRACVRTRRLRLDRTVRIDGRAPRPEERDVFFADVQADADERTNRADEPALRELRERLEALIDAHVAGCVEPDAEVVGR